MSQGSQKDVSRFDEKPKNPSCDGRQFAESIYADTNYDENAFDRNGVIPVDPNFHESSATPGEGSWRSSATDMNTRSEQELMKGYNVISLADQSGASKNRVERTSVDVMNANRGGDDGYDPARPSPDRSDHVQMDFRRGGKR
jgi:hypothetical protein